MRVPFGGAKAELRANVEPVGRSHVCTAWRRECRIAILAKSLQDTVRVLYRLSAQPDSAQDSQLKVFTEAR